jgi:hypothetical protein
MVERPHSGTAELGAPMDYPEHERMFASFVTLTKLTTLASLATVLALALFAFGGGGGFWLGVLLLILMTAGLVIGLVGKGSGKPLGGVVVLGLVLLALTAS